MSAPRFPGYVTSPDGLDLGHVVRYVEMRPKTGRWASRGWTEDVRWRAIPTDAAFAIEYFRTRREAIAYVEACALKSSSSGSSDA